MRSSVRIASVVAVFLIPFQGRLRSEEPKKLQFHREIVLGDLEPPRYEWASTLELGSIPIDSRIELILKVVNKTDRIVRLNGFSSSCRCTVQTKKIGELAPNASATVSVDITPRKTVPHNTIKFSLHDGTVTRDRIAVTCTYDLAGYLAFTQPLYRIQLRDTRPQRELEPLVIPFRFTHPIQGKKLAVSSAGAFKDTRLQIDLGESQGKVLIQVDRGTIGDTGMFGNLYLKDPVSGVVADCGLAITKVGAFVFSPRKVIMVWDGESQAYVGTAILRLYSNPATRFLTKEEPLELKLTADSRIECEVTPQRMDKLGMVHRIRFRAEVSDTELDSLKGDASVTVRFVCGNKQYTHTCALAFLK